MLLNSSLQNPPQVLKSVQIGVFCLSFCILSHSDVKHHSLTPLALLQYIPDIFYLTALTKQHSLTPLALIHSYQWHSKSASGPYAKCF